MADELNHKLPYWEFKMLFNLLVEKLHQAYGAYNEQNGTKHSVPIHINQMVGYRTSDAEKFKREKKKYPLNLTDLINSDPGSAKYIKDYYKQLPFQEGQRRMVSHNQMRTFGNYYKEKTDPPEYIVLDGFYYNVFYKFLGLNDRSEFQKKHFKRTDYKGYYYSDLHHAIASFDVAFFELNTEFNSREPKLYVEQTGFHDAFPEARLFGPVTVLIDCWTARLKHGNFFIDLSFSVSGIKSNINSVLTSNHLFGTVSGLSSQHKLLCLECVFVKEELIKQSELTVARYLLLKRNLFTVHVNNSLVVDNLDELEINDAPVGKIQNLCNKTFRVFAAAPNGRIVQSKFFVDNNYSATIVVPGVKQGKPLKCKQSFANISLQRLISHVYLDSKNLYSTTVIEVPAQEEAGQIIHGAFCICENSKNRMPIGNIMVMCEDKDSDFEPGIFSSDKLPEILNTENSRKLYEEFKKSISRWNDMG